VDLYQIESQHRAEDFVHADSTHRPGTLVLFDESKNKDSLSIGILFSKEVRETLAKFPKWPSGEITTLELSALSVATEEISHFHYLIFHVQQGRAVSQLELELQGEIDKFLVAYFASPSQSFDQLFESFFQKFRWTESLTEEQRERYQDAHQLARRFVLKLRQELESTQVPEEVFEKLRRYYRLSKSEKISLIAA
jgi:hypothetical protein